MRWEKPFHVLITSGLSLASTRIPKINSLFHFISNFPLNPSMTVCFKLCYNSQEIWTHKPDSNYGTFE